MRSITQRTVHDHSAHPQGPIAPLMCCDAARFVGEKLLSIAEQCQAGGLDHMEQAALRRAVAYAQTAIRLSREADKVTAGPSNDRMGPEHAEPARMVIEQAHAAAERSGYPDLFAPEPPGEIYGAYRRFLEIHAAGQTMTAVTSDIMGPLRARWDAIDWEVRDGAIGSCHRLNEEIGTQAREFGDYPQIVPPDAISERQLQAFGQRTATILEHCEAEINEAAVRHQNGLKHYIFIPDLSPDGNNLLLAEPLYPMTMRTLIQRGTEPETERAMYTVRFHSTLMMGAVCPRIAGPFEDNQTIEIAANTVTHLATDLLMTGYAPEREILDAITATLDAILAGGRTRVKPNPKNRQRRTINDVKAACAELRKPDPDLDRISPELRVGTGPKAHLTPIR